MLKLLRGINYKPFQRIDGRNFPLLHRSAAWEALLRIGPIRGRLILTWLAPKNWKDCTVPLVIQWYDWDCRFGPKRTWRRPSMDPMKVNSFQVQALPAVIPSRRHFDCAC